MPNKIQDWAEIVSDRLVDTVKCVMGVNPEMTTENALECVLCSSCAGPKSIELAKAKLGI